MTACFCFDLFESQREFHLLVFFSATCHSSWLGPKLGTKNSIHVSSLGATLTGSKGQEPGPAIKPSILIQDTDILTAMVNTLLVLKR